jgi:hypothetical protein
MLLIGAISCSVAAAGLWMIGTARKPQTAYLGAVIVSAGAVLAFLDLIAWLI